MFGKKANALIRGVSTPYGVTVVVAVGAAVGLSSLTFLLQQGDKETREAYYSPPQENVRLASAEAQAWFQNPRDLSGLVNALSQLKQAKEYAIQNPGSNYGLSYRLDNLVGDGELLASVNQATPAGSRFVDERGKLFVNGMQNLPVQLPNETIDKFHIPVMGVLYVLFMLPIYLLARAGYKRHAETMNLIQRQQTKTANS